MKGVPIKFRAKTDHNEDLYLTPFLNGDYDQLIGYDANGEEVYEGDKIQVGNEIVKVEWCNECTCFAVKWKNGTSDSYGTVFYRYYDKPYLVKE